MGVPLRSGLFRVAAFLIVGVGIVVSTQFLRGMDAGEATERISQFLRGALGFFETDGGLKTENDGVAKAAATTPEPAAATPEPKVTTLATAVAKNPLPAIPDECRGRNVSASSVVIGDQIQLRFFAKIGMPRVEAGSTSTSTAETVAFERLDLSGIYQVSEDGTVALPLLGRIELVGRTLGCSEALVANGVAAQDSSVTAVTASFASRLAVTVSGTVRAPGAYTYSPGMTVDRLLSLAGATFSDGPITPQEIDNLLAQRDELLRRQILATLQLRRLQANLAGNEDIDLSDSVLSQAAADLIGPMVDIETDALRQDLSVDHATDQRGEVEIAGLIEKSRDIDTQLALVASQLESLNSREDEMASLKSRGLLQASQLDALVSNLMELNRIKLQLETDQSNLQSQIELAKQDMHLAIQQRKQSISRRISELFGDISLFELQRAAIEDKLAAHGIGTTDGNGILPLRVSIERPEVGGVYRFDAMMSTVVLPGDMVSVLLLPNSLADRVTASSVSSDDVEPVASDSVQQ